MRTTETIGAVGALLVLAGASAAPAYRTVDLGALGGPSRAFALTPSGWTAGVATDGGNIHHAFLRPPGGLLTPIAPIAPDNLSVAFAATDAGEAIGVSYTLGDPHPRAFRAIGGSVVEIGTFSARGANSAGAVVGHVSSNTPMGLEDHACVLTGGALSELPDLGGHNSYARSVNDAGRVAGMSWLSGDGSFHACVWQDGVAHDLGTLGGARSQAHALNDGALAAGVADLASGDPHACLFSLDASGALTAATDLGTLGTARSSAARDVNNCGEVVGVSDGKAFLWHAGAPMIDLNSRIRPDGGWTLVEMSSINDAGEMAGCGVLEGMPRAVLLVPCPGDANGDFVSSFDDLVVILGNWGEHVPAGESGDLDNDGDIDFQDVIRLLSVYGEQC